MKITNLEQLEAIVTQKVEVTIDNLFVELHTLAKTEFGDIAPEQVMELDEIQEEFIKALKERLAALATKQVWENTKAGNNEFRRKSKKKILKKTV
jgi:hypothetical protein